jgi:arylsulfatase A-like enzyme|eukprot:COSAG02_NODE_3820_length_6190_cov_1.860121_5_plen_115_part_00
MWLGHICVAVAGWRRSQGIAEVAEDEITRSRTAYWALVHRMDRLIGEMLDAMHANGLAEDTLVVYTSDHVCSTFVSGGASSRPAGSPTNALLIVALLSVSRTVHRENKYAALVL